MNSSSTLLSACIRRPLSFSKWRVLHAYQKRELLALFNVKNVCVKRCINFSSPVGNSQPKEWNTEFNLPCPEFDLDYLCDEKNLEAIQENIENRKGVGDLYKVRELWKQWQTETKKDAKIELFKSLNEAASEIPNSSSPSSPIGDESQAKLVAKVGSKKEFSFKPKTVVELLEKPGLLRTENVGTTTGPRTYYFLYDIARLEQALLKYTVQSLLSKGFELVSVPDMINRSVIEACGFKTSGIRSQVYKIDQSCHDNLALAGTSEMPLAGYFMNEIFDEKTLPVRVCAISRCYRAETSDSERDLGIYRVHQFNKVEMFGVTTKEGSEELHQEFLQIEKELFTELGLHFRILDMPTQELGASAYRKFDIESWMPARKIWGEISSTSNCTDYQSRRLNIKYRTDSGELQHVHTVNGTACAVPRLMMSVIENNQDIKHRVKIPEVLSPFMQEKTILQTPKRPHKMRFILPNQSFKGSL